VVVTFVHGWRQTWQLRKSVWACEDTKGLGTIRLADGREASETGGHSRGWRAISLGTLIGHCLGIQQRIQYIKRRVGGDSTDASGSGRAMSVV